MDIPQVLERLGRHHRAIREELNLQSDHILTGQRMLDVHQALCKVYPKQGKQRLPGYLRYGIAFTFVKEHLLQALEENHGIKLNKREQSRVRKLIGTIFYKPPAAEHARRIRAAIVLKKSGTRGNRIYEALCSEVQALHGANNKFEQLYTGSSPAVTLQPDEDPQLFRQRVLEQAREAKRRKTAPYLKDHPSDLFVNVIPRFDPHTSIEDVERIEGDIARRYRTTREGTSINFEKTEQRK